MNRNHTTRRTARTARRVALTTAAIAGLAAFAAPAANAAGFTFDHDDMTMITNPASLSFGGVDWGQEIGSNTITGRLTGTLTFHGGLAGCARVVVKWKNAAGTVIDTDTTPEVCSQSSLPSFPTTITKTSQSTALRSVTAQLQVRNLNTNYQTIATKNAAAGGN